MDDNDRRTSEAGNAERGANFLDLNSTSTLSQPLPIKDATGNDMDAITRNIPPANYACQNPLRDVEYPVMDEQQLRMMTWPVNDLMRSTDSDFRLRVYEDLKAQELKNREDYRRWNMTTGENILYPYAHHSSLNTRQTIPARNDREFCIAEEYNLARSRRSMRTRPMRDPRRNTDFDIGSRIQGNLKEQEEKFKEDQHRFLRCSGARSRENIKYSNAHDSSLNTSETLRARGRWQYRMIDQEVTNRQQFRMRNWPGRDSSRNTYSDFAIKPYEHQRAQEMELRENYHRFLQYGNTIIGGNIVHPQAHNSFLNIRQILPARYEWKFRITDAEYNLFLRSQQFRMRTWPVRYSSSGAHPGIGMSVYEHLRAQEIKFREDYYRFFRHTNMMMGGNIMYPYDHPSSLNARQNLPSRDGWQFPIAYPEYNLVTRRQQLSMINWTVRAPGRNTDSDIGPAAHVQPKVSKIKSEEQHHLPRRTYTNSRDNPRYLNTDPSSLNTRPILPEKNRWQHSTREEQFKLVTGRRHLRMNWPSGSTHSDIALRAHEHTKEQKVKSSEAQYRFPPKTDTGSSVNITHPNALHSSNIGQSHPPRDGQQQRKADEDNFLMGGQKLGMGTWSKPASSGSDEFDLRLRVCENHLKDQTLQLNEGLRRREMENEGLRNPSNHISDGMVKESIPSQEPNHQEGPTLTDGYQASGTEQLQHSNSNAESDTSSILLEEPSKEQLKESNDFGHSDSNKNVESPPSIKERKKKPKKKKIKSSEGLKREKMDNEGMMNPKDHLVEGTAGKSPSIQEPNLQKHSAAIDVQQPQPPNTTDKSTKEHSMESNECGSLGSNENTESDLNLKATIVKSTKPSDSKNQPKNKKGKSIEGLKCRRMGKDCERNPKNYLVDGTAKKSAHAQESPAVIKGHQASGSTHVRYSNRDADSDISMRILKEPSKEQLLESHEFGLSGNIRRARKEFKENLNSKGKSEWSGSYRYMIYLLLITVIVLRVFLYTLK